jgi:anhydro-N-acetylmuramic acid kinase
MPRNSVKKVLDRSLVVTRVVGLISGTSVDGIDVAVAELHLNGTEIVLTPVGALALGYPDLRTDLLAALPPGPATAEQLTRLDTRVGQAFADAAQRAVDRFGPADLVGSARPDPSFTGSKAVRCVDAADRSACLDRRAHRTARRVRPARPRCRRGGHGAPLASTLDWLWLRGLAESRGRPAVALNIGGSRTSRSCGPTVPQSRMTPAPATPCST